MNTKTADSKGRIVLGPRFANKTVIIEDIDETEIRIITAAVIPERELWLHKNKKAVTMVQRGLAQSRAGKFSKNPPNVRADKKLAVELEG